MLSSPFGRRIYNAIIELCGRNLLSIGIWGLFLIFGLFFVVKLFQGFATPSNLARARPKFTAFIPLVMIALAGVAYALSFSMIEERLHLVLFGTLGALFVADNLADGTQARFSEVVFLLLSAIILGVFVGTIDELLQSITPGRVGDPRDVLFNAIGALWGAALWCAGACRGTLGS